MSEHSTLPAPPSSEKTPAIEVREGRIVTLSPAVLAAAAIHEERVKLDERFAATVRRLTALAIPSACRPVRDLIFVEGEGVVFSSRGEMETYVRGLLNEMGPVSTDNPTHKILKRMLSLLMEAERAPERREGNKLPCLVVLDGEARLAWLTVGVVKR